MLPPGGTEASTEISWPQRCPAVGGRGRGRRPRWRCGRATRAATLLSGTVALGYLGDRAALPTLDDAQRYIDASTAAEPVWPWVFQFSADKIASYKAIAASRLGLAKIAAQAVAQAETARSPKQAALVAVEHARALATGGDLDQALALAVTA